MITYEKYDQEIHRLFESAYNTRCNPDSTIEDLLEAAGIIDNALSLASNMEVQIDDIGTQHEIMVDKIRCCIEQLAIYTRLLKNTYGTSQFDELSQKQEQYCRQYMHIYLNVDDDEVLLSQYQLILIAYQSLAANYFRRGGMGKDKAPCQQAIDCLDEAMLLTKGDKLHDILQANKQQILNAMS